MTAGPDGKYSDTLLPGKANVMTEETLKDFPTHEKPEEVPHFIAGMVSCTAVKPCGPEPAHLCQLRLRSFSLPPMYYSERTHVLQILTKVYALCHTVVKSKSEERVYELRCTQDAAAVMNNFGRRIDRVCAAVRAQHELHKNGGMRHVGFLLTARGLLLYRTCLPYSLCNMLSSVQALLGS